MRVLTPWWLLLVSCAPPTDVAAPTAHRAHPFGLQASQVMQPAETPLRGVLRDRPDDQGLRHPLGSLPFSTALPPVRPPGPDAPTSAFSNPIRGGELDYSLGTDLMDMLATTTRRDDVYGFSGVTLLTWEEIFGSETQETLCHDPEVLFSFSEDGVDYEAAFPVPRYFPFIGTPERSTRLMSESCADGLLAAGGDVDEAQSDGSCFEYEVYDMLPEGSDCRACVEVDGDHAVCVADGACDEEMPAHMAVQIDDVWTWYDMFVARMLACAPDQFNYAFLLVDTDDEYQPPAPWDHEGWRMMCLPQWDLDLDGVAVSCFTGNASSLADPTLTQTLGAGQVGYVRHLREQGTTGDGWNNRGFFVDTIEVYGLWLDYHWAYNPGIGQVSAPLIYQDTNGDGEIAAGDLGFGFELDYEIGLNPWDERPDGESMARDYIATQMLKASTTLTGVYASWANRSRCAEDAWIGPDAEGAYFCTDLQPPEAGWLSTVQTTWADYDLTYQYALATIASSGLPDPDVPGGFVTHLAGSPALASPDWEGCSYPHTFIPDLAPMEDLPFTFGEPGSLIGHDYRFGKDDQDIRVVLFTNTLRYYCAEDGGS